jgi:hypothetical protein
MTQYTEISLQEMDTFMEKRGFSEIELTGVQEKVYGKIVAPGICLRIFSTIARGVSRPVGADAIRLVLVTRDGEHIKSIGKSTKVLRIETWRENLDKKINAWKGYLGPLCGRCACQTVARKGRYGDFWGCTRYPDCNYTKNMGD